MGTGTEKPKTLTTLSLERQSNVLYALAVSHAARSEGIGTISGLHCV
jgi:hypothetical protein